MACMPHVSPGPRVGSGPAGQADRRVFDWPPAGDLVSSLYYLPVYGHHAHACLPTYIVMLLFVEIPIVKTMSTRATGTIHNLPGALWPNFAADLLQLLIPLSDPKTANNILPT